MNSRTVIIGYGIKIKGEIMTSVLNAIGAISLLALWLVASICLILQIKNANTFRQRKKIIDAIQAYNDWCIKEHRFGEVVSCEHLRDYDSCLMDIFDWGCKNILPEQEYRLIEPFISK